VLIEGPFHIQLIEKTDTLEREIHVQFTNEFQAMEESDRISYFAAHIAELKARLQELSPESQDHQGMMMIMQLAESIRPYIESGEISLGETLVIELEKKNPIADLMQQNNNVH
jgi:hypothetical protein